VTRQNTNCSAELPNNGTFCLVYPVKVPTSPGVCSCQAMCFPIYVQAVQLSELPRTICKYAFPKRKVSLLSTYSQSSPAKTRISSPASSVPPVRRQLQLYARRKTSSKNTIFEMYSGFYSLLRFFAVLDTVQSQHYSILVFQLPFQ